MTYCRGKSAQYIKCFTCTYSLHRSHRLTRTNGCMIKMEFTYAWFSVYNQPQTKVVTFSKLSSTEYKTLFHSSFHIYRRKRFKRLDSIRNWTTRRSTHK